MALQSRDLIMVGLGVRGDAPANPVQPPLRDGIHLRWAFAPPRGFPWHGFYLYRRAHHSGDPRCLTREVRGLSPGPLPGYFLDVSFARLWSDTRLVLTESWPEPGEVEFNLDGRTYLRAAFTPQARARRVIVRLGFRQAAALTITALWDGVPVEQRRVQGRPGQRVTQEIEADSITEVLLTAGPASLIDLCYVPVTEDAGLDWQPVPNLRGRICLPVTQPNYPCSAGPEHLANARATARARIRYGDPGRLTAAPVIVAAAGTIAVTNDSPLVTGAATNWAAPHSGLILQLNGENTAYVVAAVLAPDRLVLNRPYHGVTGAGRAYTFQRDPFAQLHDYLAYLVSGGLAAGPMAGRMLPAPLAAPGTVATTTGSAVVDGAATNWTAAICGLRFRIIAASAGTATTRQGSAVLTGAGTAWTADLVGMEFEIDGDDRTYGIAEVGAANLLRLGRPYQGADRVGASYRIAERPIYRVRAVNAGNRLTLDSPYTGATAAGRRYELVVGLQAPGARNQAPRLPRFRPLDILLLGALDPAVAQMIGLYWIDDTVDPNIGYDYLLLADFTGIGNDPVGVLQAWIQSRYANAEGFIAYNLRLGRPPALAAPAGARAYALPGVTRASAFDDVAGSAGLTWGLSVTELGVGLPRSAVLYHVWRADHGANPPGAPPAANGYALRTTGGPVVIGNLDPPSSVPPGRPPDWPPFRLFFTDGILREGWYSYAVTGVDIFGRHSAAGAPAEWWQWAPVPDPRPWYYRDPAADARVHAYAIGFLDKTPPPPPAAVEAFALDPLDPTVLRDQAFNTWWTALNNAGWYRALPPKQRNNLVGLRVRWRWTPGQQAQAPDTREFRIYYQPGPCNALLGRITATAEVDAGHTAVTTDIPNDAPADAYAHARLRHGNDDWEIVASEAASPLVVRVRNVGPAQDVRPPRRGSCSIAFPDGHPRFTDYSRALAWQERFHVVPYDQNWSADPGGGGRVYEVFLPDPDGRVQAGVPLAATLADPVAYALAGVSAADNKRHTADDARWGDRARWAGGHWGGADRYGNESRVGGPATIFRVLRRRPDPPVPPLDDERVFATPADYHGRSYYTYRWVSQPNLKAHIFRALDQALFAIDWEIRAARNPLDPADNSAFPATPRWNDARCQHVAAELNALDDVRAAGDRARGAAAYRALSNDALRILAGLPGRERAFTQITVQALDPDDPANADRPGPDDPSAYAGRAELRAWVDTLDGHAANRYLYRAAYVDGAQNRSLLSLSGPPVWLPDLTLPTKPRLTKALGGNRRVVLHWAAHREPGMLRYLIYRAEVRENARDVRLMGRPVANLPASQLVANRGEVDLGPGCDVATVERVYSADGFRPAADLFNDQTAHQYLAAPTAPTGTRVTGLPAPDGTPVVVVYRDSRQALQCTRWQDAVCRWTDEGLAGPRTYYYRIVATRKGEDRDASLILQSTASEICAARAVTVDPPDPPNIVTLEWVRKGSDGAIYPYNDAPPAGHVRKPAVRLRWTANDPALASLVQYRWEPDASFANASGWLAPGVYEVVHENELDYLDNEYRIKVLDRAGNTNVRFAPVVLPAANR